MLRTCLKTFLARFMRSLSIKTNESGLQADAT